MEGTIFQFLNPVMMNQDTLTVPRFLIVLLVFIGIHIGRSASIPYGLCFGLLYDVVYTPILGVYLFGFGIIGYMFALSHKRIQDSIVFQIFLALIAVFLFECYQYGLFQLIGITDMESSFFWQTRVIPTILLNGAFAILAYYPVKKLLSYVKLQASLRER